ncbi:hypothetical protein SLEP1_g47817 [Rubroshorea leprosula]|uniref:Uncharacterized protein n=1 Tax=Rubroshorea leprosula TaxID=152421 RepID=A0AAV5LRQ0_9ROSI|nr:hypothetical protein SLEP1_g47817 [Rubroshorea leprosula]
MDTIFHPMLYLFLGRISYQVPCEENEWREYICYQIEANLTFRISA